MMALTGVSFNHPIKNERVVINIEEPEKFESTRRREEKFYEEKEVSWHREVESIVGKEDASRYGEDVRSLPAAYVTGKKMFRGKQFEVSNQVMIPREATESLIELALSQSWNSSIRILDLGTGSGCILLSLLMEIPNSTGVGLDISKSALEIADRNSQKFGIKERVEWKEADLRCLETVEFGGKFDLIISNPPYLSKKDMKSVLDLKSFEHEPHLAFVAEEDGLEFYRTIKRGIERNGLLNEGGSLILEVGNAIREKVETLFSDWKVIQKKSDKQDFIRCLLLKRK
eukprot:TRINITY_DN6076_c0_g2_i3.p1 TRINITY_DN6076_c0_g2~~TRINITY_DN6076_c0_g2_i3.p1  ORF type:complete len:286 (-),score=88.36 TRINITY_DN6076_c0_g2_i3:809-1666(-)